MTGIFSTKRNPKNLLSFYRTRVDQREAKYRPIHVYIGPISISNLIRCKKDLFMVLTDFRTMLCLFLPRCYVHLWLCLCSDDEVPWSVGGSGGWRCVPAVRARRRPSSAGSRSLQVHPPGHSIKEYSAGIYPHPPRGVITPLVFVWHPQVVARAGGVSLGAAPAMDGQCRMKCACLSECPVLRFFNS